MGYFSITFKKHIQNLIIMAGETKQVAVSDLKKGNYVVINGIASVVSDTHICSLVSIC